MRSRARSKQGSEAGIPLSFSAGLRCGIKLLRLKNSKLCSEQLESELCCLLFRGKVIESSVFVSACNTEIDLRNLFNGISVEP